MAVADVAYRVRRKVEDDPSPWDREEVEGLIEESVMAFRSETHLPPRLVRRREPWTEPLVGPIAILRRGLLWFLLLCFLGASLFIVTPGGGLALFYAGLLVLVASTHAYGLHTGDYLIGPRYSIIGMLLLGGLSLVSLVAGIEAAVKR